mgnify:CR=1 FL=1
MSDSSADYNRNMNIGSDGGKRESFIVKVYMTLFLMFVSTFVIYLLFFRQPDSEQR